MGSETFEEFDIFIIVVEIMRKKTICFNTRLDVEDTPQNTFVKDWQ